MIYLKKNVGFWQFGDRLFLDVYVPLLFASIVDVHICITHHNLKNMSVHFRTAKYA